MDNLVLLVNPSYMKKIYGTRHAPSIKSPLGLAYVAANLEQAGFKVEILDANAEFLSPQETVEKIIQSPAKYIGFTSVTATIPLIYQISSLIKAKNKNKIIIAGGPHVTFMPKEVFKECKAIDIIVRGEGEVTICELIKNLENKQDLSKIKGITFKKGNKIISNPDRELIQDIDAIPFPARHLLPLDSYSPSPITNMGFRGKQYAKLITVRGCPNKCVFCSSTHFWKIVRVRSAENVIDEIESVVKKYGVHHIDFLDDTLTLFPERLSKICTLIIEKNLNIKWSCYSRVNTITPELIALMKKAGCRVIQLGVESGNQKILDKIQKNITLEQVRRASEIIKRTGLKLLCFFMIGLPGDTKKTVNQTIEFAKELKPNFAFFSITTPFPGTALYKEYRKEGRLKEGYIWQNMNLHERTDFSTPTLTSQDLENLYFKAHHRFYYRFGFFWQTLMWILKHPHELKNFYSLAKIQIIRELRKIFKPRRKIFYEKKTFSKFS